MPFPMAGFCITLYLYEVNNLFQRGIYDWIGKVESTWKEI